MAREQASLPKTVELTMDECKFVNAALFNYRAMKIRAQNAALKEGDSEIANLYGVAAGECDRIAAKF